MSGLVTGHPQFVHDGFSHQHAFGVAGECLRALPDSALPLLSLCSTLSKCCHAMVAITYPFTWQHTYIPVLPPAMVDIVCSPTPFLIGLLTSSLPLLRELPLEEVSSWEAPVPFPWRGRGEALAQAVLGAGTPQVCL